MKRGKFSRRRQNAYTSGHRAADGDRDLHREVVVGAGVQALLLVVFRRPHVQLVVHRAAAGDAAMGEPGPGRGQHQRGEGTAAGRRERDERGPQRDRDAALGDPDVDLLQLVHGHGRDPHFDDHTALLTSGRHTRRFRPSDPLRRGSRQLRSEKRSCWRAASSLSPPRPSFPQTCIRAPTASPSWAMNATVIEACSCPMFCQCYFNAEPAGHAARVTKGTAAAAARALLQGQQRLPGQQGPLRRPPTSTARSSGSPPTSATTSRTARWSGRSSTSTRS